MSTNKTANYQLNQWEPGDQVLRTDFNEDNKKLDDALGALASKNAALEGAVAQRGNCRMEVVRYTGNGSESITIPFAEKPLWFLVFGEDGILFGSGQSDTAVSTYHDPVIHGATIGSQTISWTGGTATFGPWPTLAGYLNKSGRSYRAHAFYQQDRE